jgi:hypothetical protein
MVAQLDKASSWLALSLRLFSLCALLIVCNFSAVELQMSNFSTLIIVTLSVAIPSLSVISLLSRIFAGGQKQKREESISPARSHCKRVFRFCCWALLLENGESELTLFYLCFWLTCLMVGLAEVCPLVRGSPYRQSQSCVVIPFISQELSWFERCSECKKPHEWKFAFLTFYRFIRSSQRVTGPIIDIDGWLRAAINLYVNSSIHESACSGP